MAENKLTAMLHAFALGCLNNEDYQKLRNFIDGGGEYPRQDLGEFQNLVALIPTCLTYEAPPKFVKETIARQLYYIKDDAKEKKVKTAVPEWVEPEDFEPSSEIVEEEMDIPIPEISDSLEEILPDDSDEVKISGEYSELAPEDKVKEEQAPEPADIPEEEIPDQSSELHPEVSHDQEEPVETESQNVQEIKEPIPTEVPVEAEPIKLEEIRKPPKAELIESEPLNAKVLKTDKMQEQAEHAESKDEVKPPRSLGEFLAGAETKVEEEVGKIEFEDYFVEARKAEIKKMQNRKEKPAPADYEPVKRERPLTQPPDVNYSSRRRYRESSSSGKILTLVLVILTAAILYFYFNTELDVYKADNEKMNQEIKNLQELTTADKEVLQILGSKDSRILNLSGTSFNAYSYGKVVYSPDLGKGFIHVTSLPELKSNMSYQFWINIAGRNYPVHKFYPSNMKDFFPFTLGRVNLNQPMRIFLTEEPLSGSQTPSRTVLLSGYN